MKIVLDAMGGDHAPREIVRGAVAAVQDLGVEVVLVGISEQVEGELAPYRQQVADKITVVHTDQVIEMGEHPGQALRKKREASVVVAARMVKEGEANALVAAGNTGAAMGAALLQVGRIKGVDRPAIATPIPTARGMSLLVDAGANADARPQYLIQFAQMGAIYSQEVLGRPNPTVGLLNIGGEPEKGSELYQETHRLLKETSLNFIGNVEGRDLPAGNVDVIVCDGFVGNVVLKVVEGLSSTLFGRLRQELQSDWRSRLGALLAGPAFRRMKSSLDYREYGGAPLLGVKGVCIICHGSSDARAIKNAIGVAQTSVQQGIVPQITEKLAAVTEG